MADNKLEIEIGVEVKSLKDGVNKAKASMKSLEKQQDDLNNAFKKGDITEEKLVQETKRLNSELKKLDTQVKKDAVSIKNLTRAQKGVGTGMKKVGKATSANATPALQEFSRVIQDAPYGIQGVGNNITQLVSQFGYLSKATGGSKAAFKELGKSLLGSGGVLFLVSTLVSLLTVYGDEIKNFITSTKDAKDEQDKLNDSLQKYEDKLIGVNRARVQGQKSAQDELTNLDLLKKQVEDTTLSNKDRLRALKELQRLYPKYFGNISNEKALLGGLETAYENVSEAILKKAKAQASADLITENAKKRIILEDQLLKVSEKTNKAIAFGAKQEELYSEAVKAKVSNTEGYQKAVDNANKEVKSGLEEQQNIAKQITAIQEESLRLSKNISQEGGILGATFDAPSSDVTTDVKVTPKIVFGQPTFQGLLGANYNSFSEMSKELSNFGLPNSSEEPLFTPTYVVAPEIKIEDNFEQITEQTKELSDKMGSIINNQFADAFSGIGQVIGDAFVNGGNVLQGLGKVLLGSLGSLLTQVGQMALAVGIGLQSIQASLLTLNPAAAIGAGIALIALGSAFSSTAKSLGGGMGGGSTPSSDVGGGGSSGSRYSSSNYSSGGMGSGNVVFEIQGTKLVGVLNNTLKRNKSLGGTNNLLFT